MRVTRQHHGGASSEKGLKEVLGGGLEPPCLAAYAPQTYVSAISPPEQMAREVARPQIYTGTQESKALRLTWRSGRRLIFPLEGGRVLLIRVFVA